MISRALDRQITEFLELIEAHLARLIHVGHAVTKHMPRSQRDAVLRDAVVVAWRRREHFNPLNEPVTVWFERCLHTARFEKIEIDADELELLSRVSPVPAVAEQHARASLQEGGTQAASTPDSLDAAQKPGKDCPPCWRCRFFDGWLPRRQPKPTDYSQTEIGLICSVIDQRKIAIAKYVQGAYAPELLED